jgi:hypothetical protein
MRLVVLGLSPFVERTHIPNDSLFPVLSYVVNLDEKLSLTHSGLVFLEVTGV